MTVADFELHISSFKFRFVQWQKGPANVLQSCKFAIKLPYIAHQHTYPFYFTI